MEIVQSPKIGLNADTVRANQPRSQLSPSSSRSSGKNTPAPDDLAANALNSDRSNGSSNGGTAYNDGTIEKRRIYDAIPYELNCVSFPEKAPGEVHRANMAGRANGHGGQSIQGGQSRSCLKNIFHEAMSLCCARPDAGPAISFPAYPEISADLNRNLELGIRTARTISQLIPKVNNPLEAGHPYIIADPQLANPEATLVVRTANYADDETYGAMLDEIRESQSDRESFAALNARICGKYGIGNCAEQAAAAYISLINEGVPRVDFMKMSALGVRDAMLPHAIVVIDRRTENDQSSDENIGSPDTWNSAAVICDPWSRTAFAANDYAVFYDRMIDYANVRDAQLQFSVMQRHTA